AVESEGVADRDHGVADLDLRRVAERERVGAVGVIDLEQRDVRRRSTPTVFACWVAPSPSCTFTPFAPSAAWAFVRLCPSLSIRKPEPVAVLCWRCGNPKTDWVCWTICELMNATPSASRW